MKLRDNCRHDIQHLRLTSVRHVAAIVCEDGFQKRRNDVGVDHLEIVSFLNICVNELQNLFLDGPQAANFRCLRGNFTFD